MTTRRKSAPSKKWKAKKRPPETATRVKRIFVHPGVPKRDRRNFADAESFAFKRADAADGSVFSGELGGSGLSVLEKTTKS